MKILCAIDFTPRARSATRIAIDLARRTAGSVEFVHVDAEPTAGLQALAADVGVTEQEIREGIRAKSATETRELAGGSEVPVTHSIEEMRAP